MNRTKTYAVGRSLPPKTSFVPPRLELLHANRFVSSSSAGSNIVRLSDFFPVQTISRRILQLRTLSPFGTSHPLQNHTLIENMGGGGYPCGNPPQPARMRGPEELASRTQVERREISPCSNRLCPDVVPSEPNWTQWAASRPPYLFASFFLRCHNSVLHGTRACPERKRRDTVTGHVSS
jgi:hypothetical protein